MERSLVLLFIAVAASCVQAQKPWEPTPKPDDQAWMAKHESFVEHSQTHGDEIEIVFIGSSSIEHWGTDGLEIWNAKYAPLGSVNYGIGGDRTEHVIWRVQNGELDGISPKLVVVYIGSNNIPTSATTEEIERGVTTVISNIHEKLPEAIVLYMGFFPRGDRSNIDEIWTKITTVNEAIALEYEPTGDKTGVLNIFWDLASEWGVIKDELYTGDKLHLNADGYKQWDASWNETFYRLLSYGK